MIPSSEQQSIIDEKSHRAVIAKPGSGKTFTLSCIIKKELSTLPAYRGVIAISYTNKASNELRNRCLGTGVEKKASFFGTIDKFCISEIILPYLPHICGPLVKELSIVHLSDENVIATLGEKLIKEIKKLLDDDGVISSSNFSIVKDCYREGYIILQLVPKLALYMLINYTPVTRYLKARYSHVVIDEYQDTGEEQHQIFYYLASSGIIGIAVGDIDQSIFGFAGKDPRYLQALTQDKEFKTFSLSRNHRCHPSIINYSLKLMAENAQLLPSSEKRIFYLKTTGDEKSWGEWINQKLQLVKDEYGVINNNQCAVLIRGRKTGALLCGALRVPYKFFIDTELDSDISKWSEIFKGILGTVMDPNGNSVNWIIERLGSFEKEHRSLYRNLETLRETVKKQEALITSIEIFYEIAKFFQPETEAERPKELLKKTISDPEILNNYIPASEGEIQILTLHKSKGLEFDIVFHVDLNQWIMPGFEAIKGNKEAWRQDINLHYVGITRAKECCLLFSSTQRHYANGNVGSADPSAFLALHDLAKIRG